MEHGVRAKISDRETLSYRVRDAEISKVPYMAVIGKEENKNGTVALRKRGAGKKQEALTHKQLIENLMLEIKSKTLP